MDFKKLKKQVYEANMLIPKCNLAIHTWGNASQRSENGKYFAIKPSGVSYEQMQVDDIVVLDLEGKQIEGTLNPSSDTDTHLLLYKTFPEIKGISHSHSTYATSFAQAGKDLVTYGTTHADNFHGSIPCARSLSKKEIDGKYEWNTGLVIMETFKKRKLTPKEMPAMFVKQHGPFTFSAKNACDAVNIALTLEQVAQMAILTKKINANVEEADKFLQEKHYLRKHGKNSYYGQKK